MNPSERLKALKSVTQKTAIVKYNLRQLIDNKPVVFNDLCYCIDKNELNVLPPAEFASVETVSENFVDNLLLRAVHKTNTKLLHGIKNDKQTKQYNIKNTDGKLYRFPYKTELKVDKEYDWPTIEEFHVNKLVKLTEEYIKIWILNIVFKYYIRVLKSTEKRLSTYHYVEVMFSVPTPKCPNPQATASVFFRYEISHVVPIDTKIQVTYQFEGFKSMEKANLRFKFQQNILRNLLQSKLNIYNSIDY